MFLKLKYFSINVILFGYYFLQTPESSCSSAPATYSVDNTDKFISSNYSKTKFDWDDDVDLRKKNLIKFADAEVAKDDQALNVSIIE